jgi:hypothetical protein
LCECSDPDEWMAYHHGSDSVSDSDGSWSGRHHLNLG